MERRDLLSLFVERGATVFLTDINEEVRKLPQRYSDVWDLFRALKSTRDAEKMR